MKITMNEKRNAVIEVLKNAAEPLTLAEISAAANNDIKTGTTNAMVSAGLIKKVGTKKVAKTVYVEVATYSIGDKTIEDLEAEAAK